jgi:hypothetical protein
MPQQWRKSITVPIYKQGDKIDCSNLRGIALLPTIMCGYEVSKMILLQAYLYTYSLLSEVTFEALPLSSLCTQNNNVATFTGC